MTSPTHGHTSSGTPIDDTLIETLADEAQAGYDVDELVARRGRRGRPRLGKGRSSVESVRLDPEMKRQLTDRASEEGVTASEVIREALRQHLQTS